MVWISDGKKFVHICRCGSPLIMFYGVNYKEYGCFFCGYVRELLGTPSREATEELLKKEVIAIEKKKLFYNTHEKAVSEEEFKKWVETKK